MMNYDFILIGAGSAGCVLANLEANAFLKSEPSLTRPDIHFHMAPIAIVPGTCGRCFHYANNCFG